MASRAAPLPKHVSAPTLEAVPDLARATGGLVVGLIPDVFLWNAVLALVHESAIAIAQARLCWEGSIEERLRRQHAVRVCRSAPDDGQGNNERQCPHDLRYAEQSGARCIPGARCGYDAHELSGMSDGVLASRRRASLMKIDAPGAPFAPPDRAP